MEKTPNQPNEFDAVLGNQTQTPSGSAILGGLEGVKHRLASALEQQRIAALFEALNYGQVGLELVIEALVDKSKLVEEAAYRLLEQRPEPKVKQILREHKEHKPWRLFECLGTLSGFSDSVSSLAISPDGGTLVAGSWDKTVKLWNLGTGSLITTLEGHLSGVASVAISNGEYGPKIFSGSREGTISTWGCHRNTESQVWNLNDLPSTFKAHTDSLHALAISPDGETFVSGGDTTIKVWRSTFLRRSFKGHTDVIKCIAISPNPDGVTLASGSFDRTIKLWHLHTGALRKTFELHSNWVNSLAISPNEETLVSGSTDGTIQFWDLHAEELRTTFQGHSDTINCVAISPEGKTLVSGSWDKTVKLWNLETGSLITTLEGHSSEVTCAAISPDGQTLFTGSRDKTIKLWGVRSRSPESNMS